MGVFFFCSGALSLLTGAADMTAKGVGGGKRARAGKCQVEAEAKVDGSRWGRQATAVVQSWLERVPRVLRAEGAGAGANELVPATMRFEGERGKQKSRKLSSLDFHVAASGPGLPSAGQSFSQISKAQISLQKRAIVPLQSPCTSRALLQFHPLCQLSAGDPVSTPRIELELVDAGRVEPSTSMFTHFL